MKVIVEFSLVLYVIAYITVGVIVGRYYSNCLKLLRDAGASPLVLHSLAWRLLISPRGTWRNELRGDVLRAVQSAGDAWQSRIPPIVWSLCVLFLGGIAVCVLAVVIAVIAGPV
jgi:hypothetical protein